MSVSPDFRPLTEDHAVAPQIAPADIPAISAAGYTTILCNRPDDEVPPHLTAAAIREAAEAAGLTFVDNPVIPGRITPENVAVQAETIATSDGPVLAYCASGNRSALVWSMGAVRALGTDAVLARSWAAGYDHAMFRSHLEAVERG